LWQDVHNSLITDVRDYLAPRLRPRYYVSIEQCTYRAGLTGLTFVGRPDVTRMASPKPSFGTTPATMPAPPGIVTVELPIADVVRETYLEVRAVGGDQVVTVLEILLPSYKLPGEGREQYERKRQRGLDSRTHLVEVDLLRVDQPRRCDFRKTPAVVKYPHRSINGDVPCHTTNSP
jgi:hypothetical protein